MSVGSSAGLRSAKGDDNRDGDVVRQSWVGVTAPDSDLRVLKEGQ